MMASEPEITRGFSLVELSIVLVILGLLVGGVMTGQNLIRAAELRAVTTDIQQYYTAVMTFRDKYFALPGDMTNAYDFWGVAAGCDDVSVMSDINGCNGDGDGEIDATSNGRESANAWEHLALAGLIAGSYVGADDALEVKPGVNAPASKVSNLSYLMRKSGAPILQNKQFISVGRIRPAIWQVTGAAFETEEAYSMDRKIDDGLANQGRFFGFGDFDGGSCTGFAYNHPTGGDYLLSASGTNCQIRYLVE